MPTPNPDPTTLAGATTRPVPGREVTVGEFAARWNGLDESGRTVVLGMIHDNAAAALRCFTRHDDIEREVERIRRLHEEATTNNARLRTALVAITIADWTYRQSGTSDDSKLVDAIEAAREVLA